LTSHIWSSSILCDCRFHRAEKSFSFIWLTMIVFDALAFGLWCSSLRTWSGMWIDSFILFICLKRIVCLRERIPPRPLVFQLTTQKVFLTLWHQHQWFRVCRRYASGFCGEGASQCRVAMRCERIQ